MRGGWCLVLSAWCSVRVRRRVCRSGRMPIRHHDDLRAYQLCCTLRKEVSAIFARPGVKADSRFRDDFKAALDSAPNNIAEGFWRYSHPEFARFVVIARGRLGEFLSHLDRARERSRGIAERTLKSVTRLLTYLRTTPTPSRAPSSSAPP